MGFDRGSVMVSNGRLAKSSQSARIERARNSRETSFSNFHFALSHIDKSPIQDSDNLTNQLNPINTGFPQDNFR